MKNRGDERTGKSVAGMQSSSVGSFLGLSMGSAKPTKKREVVVLDDSD